MTSHRIGVNLRVSGNCDQGGRKYMEDYHAIKFVKKDDRDYEFAYFGIFDGHGGSEASRYARDNLLNEITKYDQFWTDNDEDILFSIRSGFLDTHQAMWRELENWPRTVSGLPSTSGTTASIAIVKKGKLYVGHVGDSGIVLGCDEGPSNAIFMKPKCLTKDHKPDNPEEKARIERCGGSVVAKAGVQRVVWSRPKVNHKGPVRRSTQIDKIPFLAVARSLGDLWSYDYYKGQFVVSPDPDVSVMTIEPGSHRCLVLGSDGLWNMLSPGEAVSVVTDLEMHFEDRVIHDPAVSVSYWINPAEKLVTRALNKWRAKLMKADNISCIVVLIDALGPSKLTLLRKRREEHFLKLQEAQEAKKAVSSVGSSSDRAVALLPIISARAAGEEKLLQHHPVTTAVIRGCGGSVAAAVSANSSIKANHNQNNVVGRENRDAEASDCGAEMREGEDGGGVDVKKGGGVHGAAAPPHNKSAAQRGGDTNPSNTHPHHQGRPLRSSATLSPESPSHPGSKSFGGKSSSSLSAASVGRSATLHHAQSSVRHPLLPRKLSHPTLGALSEMDDSVQASSAVSPPLGCPLSPTAEEEGSVLAPAMSQSLLKLMKLDAVKASSDPLPPSRMNSVSSSPALGQSVLSGGGVHRQKKQRRSAHGVLQNCTLQQQQQQQQQQQHTSLLSSSRQQHQHRHASLLPSSGGKRSTDPTPFLEGSFHSRGSLGGAFPATRSSDSNSSVVSSTSSDKTSSTRILRITTAQRSSSKSDRACPVSAKAATSPDKSVVMHNDTSMPAALGASPSLSLLRKTKAQRRDFGLLHRTRTTLRRARRAARKAFCPENRPFLKQLPGSKRKRDEKNMLADNQSTKRLRRSDGLRCSV